MLEIQKIRTRYSSLHLRLTDVHMHTFQNFAFYAAQRKRTLPPNPASPSQSCAKTSPLRESKAQYDTGDVPEADQDNALAFLKFIQDAGVKLDVVDVYKQTALFFAARDGNTKCVVHLLQHGCKTTKRDQHNQCAHFYAARQNRLETMRVLLKNKAEPNLKDNSGDSTFFFLSFSSQLI